MLRMIGIVDYGGGNLGSVSNALNFLGVEFLSSSKKIELDGCSALVFPGVCSFGFAMQKVDELGLRDFLRDWISSGKNFLGICVGMQVLLEASAESPGAEGLGVLKGKCVKFRNLGVKVPQVGWNSVESSVFPSGFAYFVNSYYCKPMGSAEKAVAAKTEYGVEFASALKFKNCFATQFHLEKSGVYGLDLLRDWLKCLRKE